MGEPEDLAAAICFLASDEARFVNGTTFIFAMVQYQFFFESGNTLQDEFSNGQFIYSLGIGFKF